MPEIKSSTKYMIFSLLICLALVFVVIQAFQFLPDESQEDRLKATINVPGDETIVEEKAEKAEEDLSEDVEETETIDKGTDNNFNEFEEAQEVELEHNNTDSLK